MNKLFTTTPHLRRLATSMAKRPMFYGNAMRAFSTDVTSFGEIRPSLNSSLTMVDAETTRLCRKAFGSETQTLQLSMLNQVIVEFENKSTLGDIKNQIIEKSKEPIKSLIFYSIEKAIIPLCETVADRKIDPILMQINGRRLFALNLNDDYSIESAGTRILIDQDLDKSVHFNQFQDNRGLKKSEKYVFPGFLRKIAVSLPRGNEFSNKQISASVSNALMYMQYKGDLQETSLNNTSVSVHIKRLQELDHLTHQHAQELDQINKAAGKKATALMALGGSTLVAQFWLIMAGTFHYYSWDIMEPVSYLMMYGNFNLSFLFYLGVKRDLEAQNVHTILKTRFAERAARKAGINIAELNKYKVEAEELKEFLAKQNIN